MRKVMVVGAGRIGSAIAMMLADSGDYELTVADLSPQALAALPAHARVRTEPLPALEPAALVPLLQPQFAVVSALPFHQTALLAEAAAAAAVHYLDLTEDVASTRRVQALAATARSALIPQCGLAPGFVSIAAADLCQRFDELHSVRLRVGALPRFAQNALGYSLTWSPEGLINQYCEPCEAIVDGRLVPVPALEGLERLVIDGCAYEAFNTSGGLGTLCQSLQGRVRELNYKTIRYPGHAQAMRLLLDELRLRERRALLRDILEHALAATLQDLVLVFIGVTGLRDGRLQQHGYAHRIHGLPSAARPCSAIQRTTAASACAVLDLLAAQRLPQQGLVRQEQIALGDFLDNRFGALFADSEPLDIQSTAV